MMKVPHRHWARIASIYSILWAAIAVWVYVRWGV
jgi:hypothetical protein